MTNMLKTSGALALLLVASPAMLLADNVVTTTIDADGSGDASS